LQGKQPAVSTGLIVVRILDRSSRKTQGIDQNLFAHVGEKLFGTVQFGLRITGLDQNMPYMNLFATTFHSLHQVESVFGFDDRRKLAGLYAESGRYKFGDHLSAAYKAQVSPAACGSRIVRMHNGQPLKIL